MEADNIALEEEIITKLNVAHLLTNVEISLKYTLNTRKLTYSLFIMFLETPSRELDNSILLYQINLVMILSCLNSVKIEEQN